MVQEERFTRKKHDAPFPTHALSYVLEESGINPKHIDGVAFYDKPYIKFERLLETYHTSVPFGLSGFLTAIPVWIKEKLFLKNTLREELKMLGSVNIHSSLVSSMVIGGKNI